MAATADLNHIEELRDAGVITDLEYSRARLRILDMQDDTADGLSPVDGRRRTRIKQIVALGLFASCILVNIDAVMVTLAYLGLGAAACAAFAYLLSDRRN